MDGVGLNKYSRSVSAQQVIDSKKENVAMAKKNTTFVKSLYLITILCNVNTHLSEVKK